MTKWKCKQSNQPFYEHVQRMSLAEQLKRLALPQKQTERVASLLYTESEAATTDLDMVARSAFAYFRFAVLGCLAFSSW